MLMLQSLLDNFVLECFALVAHVVLLDGVLCVLLVFGL